MKAKKEKKQLPDDKQIHHGKRLRHLSKRLGLKESELAARVSSVIRKGYSQQSISRTFAQPRLTPRMLGIFAKALGVAVSDVTDGEDPQVADLWDSILEQARALKDPGHVEESLEIMRSLSIEARLEVLAQIHRVKHRHAS